MYLKLGCAKIWGQNLQLISRLGLLIFFFGTKGSSIHGAPGHSAKRNFFFADFQEGGTGHG